MIVSHYFDIQFALVDDGNGVLCLEHLFRLQNSLNKFDLKAVLNITGEVHTKKQTLLKDFRIRFLKNLIL
jgi:hypothetical protein